MSKFVITTVKATRAVYLFVLDTAIKYTDYKDRRAVKMHDRVYVATDRMEEAIVKMAENIDIMQEKASVKLAESQIKTTAELNELQNYKDNV